MRSQRARRTAARSSRIPAKGWPFALVLLAFAELAFSARLGAQEPSDPAAQLSGTWGNLAGDAGKAEIERGVEGGIEGLFALGKPTARSRLRAANPPIPTLHIRVGAGDVEVDLGHGRDTKSAPGTWQQAHSAAGDPIRVRYTLLPGGVLKMESVSDGGSGRHTFRVSSDGKTLQQDVRLEASRLPNDVTYTLKYRRLR